MNVSETTVAEIKKLKAEIEILRIHLDAHQVVLEYVLRQVIRELNTAGSWPAVREPKES